MLVAQVEAGNGHGIGDDQQHHRRQRERQDPVETVAAAAVQLDPAAPTGGGFGRGQGDLAL